MLPYPLSGRRDRVDYIDEGIVGCLHVCRETARKQEHVRGRLLFIGIRFIAANPFGQIAPEDAGDNVIGFHDFDRGGGTIVLIGGFW